MLTMVRTSNIDDVNAPLGSTTTGRVTTVQGRKAGRGRGRGNINKVLDAIMPFEHSTRRGMLTTRALLLPHGLIQVLRVFHASSRTYLYATHKCTLLLSNASLSCTLLHSNARCCTLLRASSSTYDGESLYSTLMQSLSCTLLHSNARCCAHLLVRTTETGSLVSALLNVAVHAADHAPPLPPNLHSTGSDSECFTWTVTSAASMPGLYLSL